MRLRPLATLSIAAAAVVLLAGCTSSAPEAGTSPSPTPSNLCGAIASSGTASDGVTVEGTGADTTATFTAPLDITELQTTVIEEGKGDALEGGEFISVAFSAFDSATGEKLGSLGYADGEVLPQQISADTGLGQVFGCAKPGARVVTAFPANEQGGSQVYVMDFIDVVPTAAWGEPQDPATGMPTVELADDGEPSVEIPDDAPPAELALSVLKKGDGAVVGEGDTTLLQYHGVDWDTGESFDASWPTPFALPGNTYVEGFVQALVGQSVGSQVLVVIPPALAYGEAGSSDHELAGKTLVFVVDILGTQHAQAAAQ